jgi:hypothetical protein
VLELDAAVLADRGLLDRVHFPFQARQFSRVLFITPDEESRGPEYHDGNAGGDLIVCALLILRTRGYRSTFRDALRFLSKLWASESLILQWRNV